jgi:glycosyltransferase involved in cell wall biosynthesis
VPFEISVIVPAYNRGGLIVSTLDSILSQSDRPAEVVVVDDGSTDDTEAVVRRYGNGVRYLRIENSGPPCARNVGVAATTAPWIAFCDSDDLWHPDKLSFQVRLFERAPDVKYCFTDCKTVENGAWTNETKFDSLPPGYWDLAQRKIDTNLFVVEESMFERLLLRQPIFPSTVMMKRSFFESVGGWQEMLGRNPAEDVEFHLRCVSQKHIGVVSVPLVGIRKHTSNFSGNSLRSASGTIEMLRFVLKNNPTAKDCARVIEEQIIIRSAHAAETAFAVGDLERMRKLLDAVPPSQRSWRLHLKNLIAHCPNTMGQFLRSAAVALGSAVRSQALERKPCR